MEICGLHSNSLHPPDLSRFDDATTALAELPFVLLEVEAYVADWVNPTTALSKTCDDKHIQVTLCLRPPPRVSYVCVYSPDAAEINMEPTILAMEKQFILLRVTVGPKGHKVRNIDYYVYKINKEEGASLTLLPRPPSGYSFDSTNICILGYSADGRLRHPLPLDEEYILAGQNQARWWLPEGQFDLCLYDSKQRLWKTLEVSLSQQELEQHGGEEFYHDTSKVMAIGGDAGTIAFVDLWRGIIFCDMLSAKDNDIIPQLHYIKLPKPLQSYKTLKGDPRLYRNIAVIGDSIWYVELQVHYKESVVFQDQFIRNGWMVARWSRPANSYSEDWQLHNGIMDSQELNVYNQMYFKLLPKVQNDKGATLSPFMRLDFFQPVLSLVSADIIYFTAKRNHGDADGWVISVDLDNRELTDVASFYSQRNIGINFAYMHSSISAHLNRSVTIKYYERDAVPDLEQSARALRERWAHGHSLKHICTGIMMKLG